MNSDNADKPQEAAKYYDGNKMFADIRDDVAKAETKFTKSMEKWDRTFNDPTLRGARRLSLLKQAADEIYKKVFDLQFSAQSLKAVLVALLPMKEAAREIGVSLDYLKRDASTGVIHPIVIDRAQYLTTFDAGWWISNKYNGSTSQNLLDANRLTTKEAAERLNCDERAVQSLIELGALPRIQLTKRRVYQVLEEDLDWDSIRKRARKLAQKNSTTERAAA